MSKHELMEAVVSEVRTCRKCALWKERTLAVPGDGSVSTRIIFIGEASGRWEDAKGRPFVGAAGKLLDEMLSNIGLLRADVYITNIVKCRPPNNRDPLPIEIDTCTPFLDQQIKIIKPKFIVTLGRHATSHIFSKAGLRFGGITKAHGAVCNTSLLGFQVFLVPMFHPAAALYNAKFRGFLERDFYELGKLLNSE
ncbi:MAG: type-4 uracil-DNA glycosylase [Candidatus Bathyarchaeia archaeon]